VHSWTRGSQFSAGYLNSREYFSQRLLDIFDCGQSAAAKVVYLVRKRRSVHSEGDTIGEILGVDKIDALIGIEYNGIARHRTPHRLLHRYPRAAGDRSETIGTCEPQQRQLKLVL